MYKFYSLNNIAIIMKKTLLSLVIIVISIILLYSCGLPKRKAVGKEDEIIVIADSLEYERIETGLAVVFEKIIFTPQPENMFHLKQTSLNELNKYKNQKNIIIVAPLGTGSETSIYIESMLDSNLILQAIKNEFFFVVKKDLWASDQLVMIITSNSFEQLYTNLINNADDLLYRFQKISNERLFRSLYNEKYEKKDIEALFLDRYGWIIYVQADFLLAVDNPENNFVWLRRSPDTEMERWIFVHWIDKGSPEFLHNDSIINRRNKLTEKFYKTSDELSYVETASDYLNFSEVNFLNRYAILTQGLWRTTDKGMGGPFINYTFYDEKQKRIYMLDGSVFAPKYRKKGLIQQMDVTLQSFMTKEELPDDRIKDLMKRLKK